MRVENTAFQDKNNDCQISLLQRVTLHIEMSCSYQHHQDYLQQVNPKRQGSKEFVSDPGYPEDIVILLIVSQGEMAAPTVPQQRYDLST